MVFPGEHVGPDTIELLQTIQSCGGIVMGATDETLQTIEVIRGSPSEKASVSS